MLALIVMSFTSCYTPIRSFSKDSKTIRGSLSTHSILAAPPPFGTARESEFGGVYYILRLRLGSSAVIQYSPNTSDLYQTCLRSFAHLNRAGILSSSFHSLLLIHPTRFHTETLDTASKEIDMKGVNISIGKADLVVDSHLRLKAGVRYGFLGRCA